VRHFLNKCNDSESVISLDVERVRSERRSDGVSGYPVTNTTKLIVLFRTIYWSERTVSVLQTAPINSVQSARVPNGPLATLDTHRAFYFPKPIFA